LAAASRDGFVRTGLAGTPWFRRHFKSWVEDFDVALLAQIREPAIEEHIDLLFE
jgi:hypothetical protein